MSHSMPSHQRKVQFSTKIGGLVDSTKNSILAKFQNHRICSFYTEQVQKSYEIAFFGMVSPLKIITYSAQAKLKKKN
jgi:hypothetical protein